MKNDNNDIDQIISLENEVGAFAGVGKNNNNNVAGISIRESCVAEIDGRFFLLILLEIGNIDQVVIFRITAAQATRLLNAGVMRCRIINTLPTATAGRNVELICAFVVGNFVFLVFVIENARDRIVLVRVPLCRIID